MVVVSYRVLLIYYRLILVEILQHMTCMPSRAASTEKWEQSDTLLRTASTCNSIVVHLHMIILYINYIFWGER